MNQTASLYGAAAKNQAKEPLELQIAQHLEQQPAAMQAFHRWMKRLETVSVGLIPAAFILAMYVSLHWTAVQATFIPLAWFLFAASAAPTLVLVGIHSTLLQAFPASLLSGKGQKFVTGRGARWIGWGFILGGLAVAAFWGLFAYAVWTLNWALLKPLIGFLGVVMGVGIAISLLSSMVQKILRVH